MPKGICNMPECDGELAPASKLLQCSNCRGSMGMWKRRGPAAILQRRSRLRKYDSRMQFVQLHPKKGAWE